MIDVSPLLAVMIGTESLVHYAGIISLILAAVLPTTLAGAVGSVAGLAASAISLANTLGAFEDTGFQKAADIGSAVRTGATGDPTLAGAAAGAGQELARGAVQSGVAEAPARGQVPTLSELTPEQKARLNLFEAQRRSTLGRNRTILSGGATGSVGDQGSATLLGGA